MLNGKPYFLRGTNVCSTASSRTPSAATGRGAGVGAAAAPAVQDDALELAALLHRLPARVLVRHRRRGGHPDPGRVPDLAAAARRPENPKAEKIVPEYTEWMRERWNHPCVVIWDAQNESNTEETGKAIQAVRQLDLSNRPWDNGWAEPQSRDDCVESHPYLFIRGCNGRSKSVLASKDMAKASGRAVGCNRRQQKLAVPIIINEYDWLWLNRDGTPTCLTDEVYENLLGPDVDGRAAAHAPRPLRGRPDRVLAVPPRGGRRAALLRPGLLAPRRQAPARRRRHQRRFHRPREAHVRAAVREVCPRRLLAHRDHARLLGPGPARGQET